MDGSCVGVLDVSGRSEAPEKKRGKRRKQSASGEEERGAHLPGVSLPI